MARTTPPPPAATQEEPTRERGTDSFGRQVDEWGLPFSGPARLRMLDGRTDPAIDPAGWTEAAMPELDVLPAEVPAPIEVPVDEAGEPPAPPATPSPPSGDTTSTNVTED